MTIYYHSITIKQIPYNNNKKDAKQIDKRTLDRGNRSHTRKTIIYINITFPLIQNEMKE